jgi:hypothetical protein
MPSVKFNAHLNTFHHGPPRPFKDVRIAADNLSCILNAIVTCLLLLTGAAYTKGFWVSSQLKLQRIKTWLAWRLCSTSFSW